MDFGNWASWAQALLSGIVGAIGGGLIAAGSAARAVKTQFILTAREAQRVLEMGKLEEVIRLASTLIVELDQLQTAVEQAKLSPTYRTSSSYSLIRTIVDMYLPELDFSLKRADEALDRYYGSLERVDQFWRSQVVAAFTTGRLVEEGAEQFKRESGRQNKDAAALAIAEFINAATSLAVVRRVVH